MKIKKNMNVWEKFNIQKKLANELRRILNKMLNKEELNEEELEFINYIAKGEKV